jgi:predicted GIY-YIG superfamily endonuclease
MKEQCVYLLNKIVGEPRGYVGSTTNKYKRFKAYQSGLGGTYIERSITKNGWDAFQKIEIDVKASTEKELRAWEGFYIKLFGTYKNENPEFGMNIVKDPVLAISKDPEVARKISESMKGRSLSEETKIKIRKATKGINIGVKRPYLSERNKITKPALGRTGSQHPMSKKVLYVPENKIFESIKDVGDYFGVTRQAILSRIKYNPLKYKYL